MFRSTVILALVLLGVARTDGALNEPERRIRLGTCGGEHCVWCDDQFDAFCPASGATIVHDDQCNLDFSCDVGDACALDAGTSFSGELVMMVDDAPCGAATGVCDRGNGAVTKLAFCGKRADDTTFNIATTKIDCCRQAASPTGNVACGAVADACFPRGNPFLCDQEHGNCSGELTSCCMSEDIIPDASWLGLQIFAAPMADALRLAVPGSGLPVMTASTDLGLEDHQADGQPSIQRYAVEVSFVTPPSDFDAPGPDCQVTQAGTPTLDATCDFCGDGEVDPGESCDDGSANGTAQSCCDPDCALIPDCTTAIGGKVLFVKDNAGPTKRKIVFVSKDPAIDTTAGSGIDPATNGASFQLYNANGSGESVCLPLPGGSAWTTKGQPSAPRFSYKDPTSTAGPCTIARVKNGKLLKVVCLSKTQPIAYSLDEPTQDTLAVRFVSGATTYCATFGGDLVVDSGTDPPNAGGKGKFKAKKATAVPCPPAPVPCP